MPQIPTYDSRAALPASTGGAFASPDQWSTGGVQFARAAGKVADEAFGYVERFQKAADTAKVSNAVMDYQQKLYDLRDSYETSRADPKTVASDYALKSADALKESLADITDPRLQALAQAQAREHQMSIGVTVNDRARKRFIANEEADVTDGLITLRKRLTEPDPTTGAPLPDEQANILKGQGLGLLDRASKVMNPQKVEKLRQEFYQGINTDNVVGWINRQADPYTAWEAMRSGDMPPSVANSYKYLSPEQQSKLRKDALSQSADLFRLSERGEQQIKTAQTRQFTQSMKDFYDAKRVGDQAGMDQALGTIAKLDRVTDGTTYGHLLEDRYKTGAQGTTDPAVKAEMEMLLATNRLTPDRIASRRGKGLSNDDADMLLEKSTAHFNQRYNQALEYMKRSVAYPPTSIVNPTEKDREAMRVYNDLETNLVRAMNPRNADGSVAATPKDFDPLRWAMDNTAAAVQSAKVAELADVNNDFNLIPPHLRTIEAIDQERQLIAQKKSKQEPAALNRYANTINRRTELMSATRSGSPPASKGGAP